ncbi:pentatricopeptide repeat-containing protein [Quercus suber]|uniref:Pentatricopeptide repeat-containing protein n=1 Tax=Quercus suber TaxID=58331 RepID=A0AAW0JR11_QUESU
MAAFLLAPSLPKQRFPIPLVRTPTRIPASIHLLQLCQNYQEVKQLHAQLVVTGLLDCYPNAGRLLESYVKTSQINSALSIFHRLPSPDVFAFNTMIRGFTICKCPHESLLLYNKLLLDGLTPDNYTYTFVLKACSHLEALSEGYTKNDMYLEALGVFHEMMVSQVHPNESTLVSSLSACAHLGALDQGRWIHAYLDKAGVKIGVTLGTALIDMYAKCGSIRCGYELFQKMPQKDIVTWGVIISGFALHGQAEKCFQLFDEMVASGTYPNEVIFVAVLSACSHAGYVELGHHYFNQMIHDFGIRPSIEHYGCMVDLLGRAGQLLEAEKFIMLMPEEPNSIIWGALLSACRTYGDVRRGNHAFKHLIELEPLSGDRYKLAGLMLTSAGEKADATKIRKFIKKNDLETTCGMSFVEIDGVVHEFVAGDIDHSKLREINGLWKGLMAN